MKRVCLIIFLFFIIQIINKQPAFSQTKKQPVQSKPFAFPVLSKSGKTPEDFIPQNWDVIDSISGDLNKDGNEDRVMILEYQDSIRTINEYNYPRILLIAFEKGNRFELKLQHNTFIERTATIDPGHLYPYNPYQGMTISKGVLRLNFGWDERGAGTRLEYVIRYQSNDFYLIGAKKESGYRSDTRTSEFNFSTRKYVFHEVDIESGFGGEDHEYNRKRNLPANALKKISELKTPLSWRIFDDDEI